jgi:heme oxygenase
MDENANQRFDAFLRDLRNKTGASHKSLEDRQLSRLLLDPSLSSFTYQLYLSKLYRVVRACEAQVFPLLSHLLKDLPRRQKAELIFNDLIATGMSQKDIAGLPVHHFQEMSIAQAMGAMYVLEGATLGGRILYRHINETLGLNQESGASYFWGYGAETGIMWKIFLSALSHTAVEKKCEDEIIRNAEETFKLIDNLLAEAEVTPAHEN